MAGRSSCPGLVSFAPAGATRPCGRISLPPSDTASPSRRSGPPCRSPIPRRGRAGRRATADGGRSPETIRTAPKHRRAPPVPPAPALHSRAVRAGPQQIPRPAPLLLLSEICQRLTHVLNRRRSGLLADVVSGTFLTEGASGIVICGSRSTAGSCVPGKPMFVQGSSSVSSSDALPCPQTPSGCSPTARHLIGSARPRSRFERARNAEGPGIAPALRFPPCPGVQPASALFRYSSTFSR